MNKVLKGLKWFILHIEEVIACIALSIMLCVIFFNVIMRYIFRNPLNWSDELSMICLAYVTFVGGAAAYKKNLHFGIDIILDKLPEKARMGIRIITNFVFIILFGYTCYLGWVLTKGAVKKFNYSGWSYKIMDFALPLGFLSMCIYAVRFFIMAFTDPKAYKHRYEQTYEEENVDNELIKTSEEMFRKAEAIDADEGERRNEK
ncbi:MAG: TRAP transporter small permease [Anaerolineaceae bacterium]|nr:TRAP transporter small permease [Oscillospiraceae bacterium]MBQ6481569.1 TRAP transporter small permease [Anaerolineaceae bacterium]